MTQNQSIQSTGDVVDLLLDQHRQVRQLLEAVTTAAPDARQQAFDELREFLARHETAEEMVVRPLTRKVDGGEAVASGRMDEENESKKVLAELEKLDVTSNEFTAKFGEFRTEVLAHADAEEREEFPLLRSGVDNDALESARGKLEKAEQSAPTHPHPSAKTTAMNYIAGPFAAMLDRARDAFSSSSR